MMGNTSVRIVKLCSSNRLDVILLQYSL